MAARKTRISFPKQAVIINGDMINALVQEIKNAFQDEKRTQLLWYRVTIG
jgi:hypothetical protein